MSIELVLNNYKIIDLSHTMEEEMPRPQVPYGHIPWKSYAKGDAFNTNMFLVFEHSGTHVDAPIHLGGVEGQSIDQIPPESWMGSCLVLDMSDKAENEEVSAEVILDWESKHGKIDEGSIVLLKSSSFMYRPLPSSLTIEKCRCTHTERIEVHTRSEG